MSSLIGGMALLLPAFPGFLLNLLLLGKDRKNEAAALSWLTGSVIFTLLLYFLNYYLGIRLDLSACVLVLSGLTIGLFIFTYKNLSFRISLKPSLLWLFIPIYLTAFFFPVTDWDAVTLFDFRARILLDSGFISRAISLAPFIGYPMYTSLLHFWAYISGLWTAMPVYPLFTLSLVAGIYSAVRRIYPPRTSLFISLACLFSPKVFSQTFIAYTNLPYLAFLILGAIYIYLWIIQGYKQDLITGVLFSMATFWVRLFPFALVNLGLLSLAVPFIRRHAGKFTLGALLLLAGAYFVPAVHPVADYLKWAVYGYYSPYWLLFLGFLVYSCLVRSRDWFWPLLYLGYGLVLLAGTWYLNRQTPGYYLNIPDAVQRIAMFINPAVVLYLASGLKRTDKSSPKPRSTGRPSVT